jgi:hypothetical protein
MIPVHGRIFIANGVLDQGLKISASDWILSWHLGDDGTKQAKHHSERNEISLTHSLAPP